MQIDSKTLLCRYRYDALDRLVASTPLAQADTQRFYLKDRITTEIQGAERRSIMQHEDQLLAQQQRQSGPVETRLLATDQQRSVLNVLAAARRNPFAYTPYGHRHPESGLLSLLGFNGERPDPVTGHYLLGNGYRAFNPVLMRFNSPDSWSPFGEGGLNAYAYCEGDPLNLEDRSGHALGTVGSLLKLLSRKSSRKAVITSKVHPPKDPLAGTYTAINQSSPIHQQIDLHQPNNNRSVSPGSGLPPTRAKSQKIDEFLKDIVIQDQDSLKELISHYISSKSPFEKNFLLEEIHTLDKAIVRTEAIIHVRQSNYKNPYNVIKASRNNTNHNH